jgi:protein phosphatase 1 regulatory subunit 7
MAMMIKSYKRTMALAKCLVLLVLTAYSHMSNATSAGNILLAQLNFADPALAQCVQQTAAQQHWQFVHDVVELKCHGMHIQQLDGLAQLVMLKSLSLYNNDIEQADLTALKQLTLVNLANNQLNQLNITQLSHLTTLYIFKNKLSYVNFDGLAQVIKLRAMNNSLTDIDISSMQALQQAYFFDNKLKDLNIAGLKHLQFLEVRQNPMPDAVYDRYDAMVGVTIVHDGNADDWK